MRLQRYFTSLLFAAFALCAAFAEEVQINVNPVRNILPPQVMYYISNPGQYFNISVQNTTDETQLIYFGTELRQLTPTSDIEIIVPGKTIPKQPIEIPAKGTKVMTAVEMQQMFNHVRMSDIVMPENLFDDFASNNFGNLPEGTYEIIMSAYKWDPYLSSPVLISNPALSRATFTVCYQAKAPQWVMPTPQGDFEDKNIATLSKQTPLLTWIAPVVPCSPTPRTFYYDLKIVQQMPLQAIEEAIERNPTVYEATNLTMPQCMLPINVVNNLSPYETYIAQITATSNATQIGSLEYIDILNDGKSELKMFRVKDYSGQQGEITKYSAPNLLYPAYYGSNIDKFAQFDPTMPVVRWEEPKKTGFAGRSVSFSYTIRIVEPNVLYAKDTEGMKKALEELKPIYEVDGLRDLQFTIPDATINSFEPDNQYLLEVIARPDTILGAYKQFEFADDGRSRPSIFACLSAVVSPPRFENIKSFDEIDFQKGQHLNTVAERIYKEDATITWSKPQVRGELDSSIKFTYDLKVVEPNDDYEVSLEGMNKALDELDPVFEESGITINSFTFPLRVYEELELTQGYLVRITAHLNGSEEKLKKVYMRKSGHSVPALVAFSTNPKPTTYTAPTLLNPKPATELVTEKAAELSGSKPAVEWAAPEVSGLKCDPVSFTYRLKIVEPTAEYEANLEGAKKAVEELPAIYEATDIKGLRHDIPKEVVNSLDDNKIYVMRLYAVPDTVENVLARAYTYVNKGMSTPSMFRFTDIDEGNIRELTAHYIDTVYNFINPEITVPKFLPEEGARKQFINSDIAVAWRQPSYYAGGGFEPDTVKFAYDIELFSAVEFMKRDEMLAREPVYVMKNISTLTDTIRWDNIKDKVNKGDYIMLRVKPHALNDTTVAYLNDSINVIDFAMSEVFHHRYFQCANQVNITNTKPTSRKAADLKGKSVKIGEYELLLDDVIEDVAGKEGHFKGNGHVIWEPLAFTWKLAVKFDDIIINDDDQVVEGNVETWGGRENKVTNAEVVDKLFSDWGIDNLIGDTGIPYANQLQSKIDGKIQSIAETLNIKDYYQEIVDGKAFIAGLTSGNIENVTFPLEIPEDINPTSVNLTISKMKFAPTYATMDLFGTFVVPNSDVTNNQILVFGAPRMCISPKSLIPEGGTVALLKDFEIQEKKSGYKCKFLAPKDVIEPSDGCFVSWSENRFEWINLDIEMTMPKELKKVVEGKRTEESPKLLIETQIKVWEEDFIATASLDPFEHEDLPGYVFTAENVVIDLAKNSNHNTMGEFPKDYDFGKLNLNIAEKDAWEGLYMKELSMSFPKSIKIGNQGESMKVGLKDMFIDNSGISVDCGIENVINYRAGESGTIGGFAFTMDEIGISIIQNDFRDCHFSGTLDVPLFKSEKDVADGKGAIDYRCNIYNQRFTKKGTGKGYAYIFKTSQVSNLNFDFVLGKLKLDKDMTYFLVEATPDENDELKTNVELCVGGEVTVAGTETLNAELEKLPFKLKLPSIKFCKMRIANCKSFESVYEKEMQDKARDAITAMDNEVRNAGSILSSDGWWNTANDIKLGDDCYLNLGQWGAASPEKYIGPFKLTLKSWKFGLGDTDIKSAAADLSVTLEGEIKFVDELDITASTKLEFVSTIKNINELSKMSLNFKEVVFHEATFAMDAKVFSFEGSVSTNNSSGATKSTDKGYKGLLKVEIADGLFALEVQGGYFDHKEENNNFSWGFFYVLAGGKMGIDLPPIVLEDIHGGLYFNCQYNKDDKYNPKPKKGAIGIIFGMGICTTDRVTVKGSLELTVAFNYKTKTLNSFIFEGGVKCVGGIIDTKVKLVYENNENAQYFQLNLTVDAAAEGGLSDLLGDWASEINEEFKEVNEGFKSAVGDNSEDEEGEQDEAANEEVGDAAGAKGPGAHVELEIYVGHEKTLTSAPDAQVKTYKNGPTKWHVYLGLPDPKDKRCRFTLVDFHSKIVTVSVGADAYFCLGNELPGDGQLPPIPKEISDFLDGGQHGSAMSDNKSEADNAQQKAMADFIRNASEGCGGVMLGASVWGKIKVDLGLFYASMDAIAGFDVSIHTIGSMRCMNLGKAPGHNGWYGEGQIYAYLAASMGLRINLGFFKKNISLIDCGIGGVLRCGMPNPNHFEGKARVKIRLLGGLVNLNKKFSFECGEKCEMFYGNALDDYILFEKCNIAMKDAEEAASKPIDWEFQSRPVISTQAILEHDIHVVDPTEMHHMMETCNMANANDDDFEEWASRRFRFEMVGNPHLYEYYSYKAYKEGWEPEDSCAVSFVVNDESVVLTDMKRLNPNRFYRLTVKGKALEYYGGAWKDPWTFDTITNSSSAVPWNQTVDFFMQTNDKLPTYTDDTDLQPFVKVAFPAMWSIDSISGVDTGDSKSEIFAYAGDVKHPWISLDKHHKGQFYNKGQLKWYLRRDGRNIQVRDNVWYENDSVSIMTPGNGGFTDIEMEKVNNIRLIYEWSEQVESSAAWVECESYEVYGASRDEVYTREHYKYMQKYYGLADNYYGTSTIHDVLSRTQGSSSSSSNSTTTDKKLAATATLASSSSSSTSTIGTQMSRTSSGSTIGSSISTSGISNDIALSKESSETSTSSEPDFNFSGVQDKLTEDALETSITDPNMVKKPGVEEDENEYRFTLEQDDYMNDDDDVNGGARNLKFKVTIYKNTHAMVDVHYSKELLGLAVIPKEKYNNMTFEEYMADQSHIYDRHLLAVRLDKLTSGQIPSVSDDASVYLNAMQTPGAKLPTYSMRVGYKQFLKNRYITKDPFFFLTFMAKGFFVGGHRFWSPDKQYAGPGFSYYGINFQHTNLQALNLKSPYTEWTDDRLDDLQTGYESLKHSAMFSYDYAVNNLGNPYPLYSDGSEYMVNMLGNPVERGFITQHKMTEEAFAKTLADYYYMSKVLCTEMNYKMAGMSTFSITGLKQWMSMYASRELRIQGRYNPDTYIRIFNYQWGIIPFLANISKEKTYYNFDFVYHSIFPDVDVNNLHPRIGQHDKHTAPVVRAKLFLAAIDTINNKVSKMKYDYSDYANDREIIDFDAEKIAQMDNYQMQFSTYRVNAWNINKNIYTVFKPTWQSIQEINDHFCTTYSESFLNLISKYNLKINYVGSAPSCKPVSGEATSSSVEVFEAPN